MNQLRGAETGTHRLSTHSSMAFACAAENVDFGLSQTWVLTAALPRRVSLDRLWSWVFSLVKWNSYICSRGPL